jgi:2-oxoisovalerate dehydrogenase E2 component (dihydrolipoyl transacylase)
MTQMRKGIAAQMTRALQAPHAYVQMEVDVTGSVSFREKARRTYQAKEGIGLSLRAVRGQGVAEALKKNPTFNAHWTDDGLLAKRRINIGVAGRGRRGPDRPGHSRRGHALDPRPQPGHHRRRQPRAREQARVDDFGGGTFTVDNTGYLGTNMVMPILNVPEVGIVTMEAITKRPVVVSTRTATSSRSGRS